MCRPISIPMLGIILISQLARTAEPGNVPNSEAPGASLAAGFVAPPDSARPHTWWHWMNGNISRDGITADLEAMAEAGVGGAQIFNVSCDIPAGKIDYMSEAWLELLQHSAKEAKRLGLELGVHNCAGWATTGGPWVKPEDGMQAVAYHEVNVQGGKRITVTLPRPELALSGHAENHDALAAAYHDIAVLAFPTTEAKTILKSNTATLQGTARAGYVPRLTKVDKRLVALDPASILDVTAHMTSDGTLVWDAPEGEWTILRLGYGPTGQTNGFSPSSGRGLEVDKMSRRGVDVHWQHGIQPMLDKLGPLAGSALTTILIDSYEAGSHSWTRDMLAAFRQRRGYDMAPYLVTFTGRAVKDERTTKRFYYDFRRTVGDLVEENYYGYVAELCHRHGLKLAIEPYRGPFESMAVATKADLPMGECFADLGYGLPFLKLASSAAHLNGLSVAGAEAFTGVDKWAAHPGSLKFAGDLAWTRGINRFIFHRFAHQPWADLTPGMTMGRYGFHFEPSNTWWKPGKAWLDYITRSQFLLQSGESVNDVLYFTGETVPNTAMRQNELMDAGYDYDLFGTDFLPQVRLDDGAFVVPNGRRYRLLVLQLGGGMKVPILTRDVARKIRTWVRDGGAVLAPKPIYVPSLKGFPEAEAEVREIAEEVWGECDGKTATSRRYGKGMIFSGISIAEAMAELAIAPDVKMDGDRSVVKWIHRSTDDADIYFVSNPSKRALQAALGFRVTGRSPELWDAVTGTISPVPTWAVEGEHTSLPIALNADGSMFVVFRKPAKPAADPIVKVEDPERQERNQLVFHRADYITTGRKQSDEDVTEKLYAQLKGAALFDTTQTLAGGNKSPFWNHVLYLDYQWGGVREKVAYQLHDLVAVPARHLLEASWLTEFTGEPSAPLLRTWSDGDYVLKRASGKSETLTVEGTPQSIAVDGSWDVRFQKGRGAPDKARFDRLISWTDHEEAGIRHFSGTAAMTTTFELPTGFLKAGQELWLDLGEVGVMAEVRLNGKELGTLWHPPFRLDVSQALQAGKNTLEVEVTNLWINRLIGDEQEADDCEWDGEKLVGWPDWLLKGEPRPLRERITFASWKHWQKDDPLQPSGLRGPVVLRYAALTELPR